jgi:hypothetical protein
LFEVYCLIITVQVMRDVAEKDYNAVQVDNTQDYLA